MCSVWTLTGLLVGLILAALTLPTLWLVMGSLDLAVTVIQDLRSLVIYFAIATAIMR